MNKELTDEVLEAMVNCDGMCIGCPTQSVCDAVGIKRSLATALLEERTKPKQAPVFQSVPYQTGWVCPRCGSVYGPMHSECSRCNPPMKFEITC